MSSVRLALEQRLKADTILTGMLSKRTAVYHGRAAPEAAPPLIILSRQSGTDVYTFGGRAWVDQVWLVKAVDRGRRGDKADTISDRLDVVLTDAPLTLPTGLVLYCRREGLVDYPEPFGRDGREELHHCGGLFRLVTAP